MFDHCHAAIQHAIQRYPKTYAIAGCLFCTGSYLGLLLIRSGGRSLPRNHPSTIKHRMVMVSAASSIAWVPLYLALPKAGSSGRWPGKEACRMSCMGGQCTEVCKRALPF